MFSDQDNIAFDKFFINEFNHRFKRSVDSNELLDEPSKEVMKAFSDKIVQADDPVAKIEDLALIENTSEITIFLSELIENAEIIDPSDLMETLDDKTSDLSELLGLMTEEDGFVNSIDKFNQGILPKLDNETVSGDLANSETIDSDVEAQPNDPDPTIPDFDIATPEEKTELKRPANIGEERVFKIQAMLQSEFESNLYADLPSRRMNLCDEIISKLYQKDDVLTKIIPAELSTLFISLDEIFNNSGLNLYKNVPIIKENLLNLDEDFIGQLEQAEYDFVKALEDSESQPEIIDKKKSVIQNTATDKKVREKLKTYFNNEVNSTLSEIKKIILSVGIHQNATGEFKSIQDNLQALKDLSIIHGYESIELVSTELSYLLDEILSEPLVYTDNSASIFTSAIEKIFTLLESDNDENDQLIIKDIIEQVNVFNDSLALVDFEDESETETSEATEKIEMEAAPIIDSQKNIEEYNSTNQLVKNNCFDIIAKLADNYIDFDKNKNLIKQNYQIIQSNLHVKLLTDISELSANEAEFGFSEYKDLLIRDLLESDVESFRELFVKSDDDIHDFATDIKNDQKFSFNDILERPGVYESILLKKISGLIESFDEENVESILVISSAIEFETRWLGYDQIADLFNFFTLNLDDYFNAKARSRLMEEFSKILSSVSKYKFNIEDFTEKAEEETIEEGLEIENTQWINQVADILETEEIDLSIDMATINLDAFADIDSDIQTIFNEEANSYINELERQLDQIDSDSGNLEAIVLAEKAAHTLKGASRMLNIATIGDIAYKIEKVFENASITKKHVNDSHVNDIRHLLKVIRTIISGDESQLKQALEESKSSQKVTSEEDLEMLEIFQDESKTNIENIDQSIDELKKEVKHDAIKRMESDALSLKSAAKMLGFKKIGFLSEAIERATEAFRENTNLINEKTLDYLNDIVLLIKKLRLGEEVSTKAVENVINEFTSFLASQSLAQEQEDITDIVQSDLDEFQELFLEESASIITQLSSDIDKFIGDQKNTDLLNRIQSDVHTVKGSASMVNFKKIHEIMNLIGLILDAASNNEIDDEKGKIIKDSIFEVDSSCNRLKQGKKEGSDELKSLIENLKLKIS